MARTLLFPLTISDWHTTEYVRAIALLSGVWVWGVGGTGNNGGGGWGACLLVARANGCFDVILWVCCYFDRGVWCRMRVVRRLWWHIDIGSGCTSIV